MYKYFNIEDFKYWFVIDIATLRLSFDVHFGSTKIDNKNKDKKK